MGRLKNNIISTDKKKFHIVNKNLTKKEKNILDAALKRFFREYGSTLKLLGQEKSK